MKVVDAMRKEIVTINEETSVAEASTSMREKGEGCAIILRKGTPVGIVTERDVTWKVAGNGLDPKRVKVSGIMSAPLVTIDPDASLIEAAKIMEEQRWKDPWSSNLIRGFTSSLSSWVSRFSWA